MPLRVFEMVDTISELLKRITSFVLLQDNLDGVTYGIVYEHENIAICIE